jgi:Acyltransferase
MTSHRHRALRSSLRRARAGDNLDLPVVGRIMRTCGAFFIRRATKGADARVYKAALDAYLRTLLFHGIPIEFFIEGGRVRDGRIAAPKLGLLASCVDAALAPRCAARPLHIVPVTITYDMPLEETGLLLEMLGQPKQKETVLQFVCAFGALLARVVWRTLVSGNRRTLGRGGRNGRVAVGFGAPVSVAQFLRSRQKRRKKRGGAKKGALSQVSLAAGAPPRAAARFRTRPRMRKQASAVITPTKGALSSKQALAHVPLHCPPRTCAPWSTAHPFIYFADLGFEDVCELSRSGAVQSDGTATPRSPPGATAAAVSPGGTPASPESVDTLAAAFPEGSAARRTAVAALGHELHVRMLATNVVPSTALFAAALLPGGLVPTESASDVLVRSGFAPALDAALVICLMARLVSCALTAGG